MAALILQLIANALIVFGATILALFSVSDRTIEMIYRRPWVSGHKFAYFPVLLIIYVFGRSIVQGFLQEHDVLKWLLPLAVLFDAAGVPQAPNWLAITIEVGAFSLLIAFGLLEILFINVFSLPDDKCETRDQRMAQWNVCALIAVLLGFAVQMAQLTMSNIVTSQ